MISNFALVSLFASVVAFQFVVTVILGRMSFNSCPNQPPLSKPEAVIMILLSTPFCAIPISFFCQNYGVELAALPGWWLGVCAFLTSSLTLGSGIGYVTSQKKAALEAYLESLPDSECERLCQQAARGVDISHLLAAGMSKAQHSTQTPSSH